MVGFERTYTNYNGNNPDNSNGNRKYRPEKERLKELRKIFRPHLKNLRNGQVELEEVIGIAMKETGVCRNYLCLLIHKAKIPLPKKVERTTAKIRKLAKQGLSADEIAQECQVNTFYVMKLARRAGINLPKNLSPLTREEIEEIERSFKDDGLFELIKQGCYTEVEIARKLGLNEKRGEIVRQQILNRRLYRYWKHKREEYHLSAIEEAESMRTQFTQFLIDLADRVGGFSEREALLYQLSTIQYRNRGYSLELLKKFLSDYEQILNQRLRTPPTKLAEKHGLFSSAAYNILRTLDLPYPQNVINFDEEMKKIRVNTSASYNKALAWRLAGKIFDYSDNRIPENKISGVLGIPLSAVRYALSHRKEILEQIVKEN